jgi:hypothetical protein
MISAEKTSEEDRCQAAPRSAEWKQREWALIMWPSGDQIPRYGG